MTPPRWIRVLAYVDGAILVPMFVASIVAPRAVMPEWIFTSTMAFVLGTMPIVSELWHDSTRRFCLQCGAEHMAHRYKRDLPTVRFNDDGCMRCASCGDGVIVDIPQRPPLARIWRVLAGLVIACVVVALRIGIRR